MTAPLHRLERLAIVQNNNSGIEEREVVADKLYDDDDMKMILLYGWKMIESNDNDSLTMLKALFSKIIPDEKLEILIDAIQKDIFSSSSQYAHPVLEQKRQEILGRIKRKIAF